MKVVSRSEVLKKGRVVPIDYYLGTGRRIRVILAYGYFKAIVPVLNPETIAVAKNLCAKFRAAPRGIRPFGPDYLFWRGQKKTVYMPTTISPEQGSLAFKDEKAYAAFIKKESRTYFLERMELWKQRMNINEDFKLRVTDSLGNLGSYSRRTLTVSLAVPLLAYTPHLTDAIIVHELAHHRISAHSPAFYDLIYSYLPDYEQLEKQIREGYFEGVAYA